MSRTSLVVALAFAAPLVAQAQDAKPDLNKGSAIAQQTCVACHNQDGNSALPANPKLAAQHAEYLIKQLRDFKVAEGATAAKRENAIMAGFAAMLSEADVRDVSYYFASQALKPEAAKDPESIALGQQIYRGGIASKGVPACAGCHSPNGAGIPALYPRLQGQFSEYLASQMVLFREHGRKNSPEMTAIAERMLDREIRAVSDYIAGLR